MNIFVKACHKIIHHMTSDALFGKNRTNDVPIKHEDFARISHKLYKQVIKMLNITRKHKGRAAQAKQPRQKCSTSKQTPSMHVEMRATRDMLFTQAVNLMHEAENSPMDQCS